MSAVPTDDTATPDDARTGRPPTSYCGGLYEDHANKERVLNDTFAKLKDMQQVLKEGTYHFEELKGLFAELAELTAASERGVSDHLMQEETVCMPVIQECLSITEMTFLVGVIMEDRSTEQVRNILTLALNTLPSDEKDEMLVYMNKATQGTFFERWALPQFRAGEALLQRTYEDTATLGTEYGEGKLGENMKEISPPEGRKSSPLLAEKIKTELQEE